MQQVSMQEMNTDEPLVEASIVGNKLPEGKSYKGIPISTAAVNRSRLCGNRSKGGMTCIQALPCNRGEPPPPERKRKVESPSRRLSKRQWQSDQFIVVMISAERRKERRDWQS
jgi:hypothetical protein